MEKERIKQVYADNAGLTDEQKDNILKLIDSWAQQHHKPEDFQALIGELSMFARWEYVDIVDRINDVMFSTYNAGTDSEQEDSEED